MKKTGKIATFQRYGKLSVQEENQSLDYWKDMSKHYEFMFLEQREICKGYRKIVEGYEQLVKDLKLNK